MLKLKLFGSGQASLGSMTAEGSIGTSEWQSFAHFPSQQAHLLLCYLLLNSKYPHLRDQLASVFWGEYTTQASRKYLRNSLWKLRQMFEEAQADLDDYLFVNDESVTFIRTSPYWLDVEVFEGAVEACQDVTGQEILLEQANALEEAVELYAGDLLEGVDFDWCIYERERLNLLYLEALHKLMVYHAAQGSYERGLAYGERILGQDPTREKVHVQMMRLYWLLGNRSAALAQYKRCVQILREELGIAPLQDTTAVYQQMIHNQFSPPVQRVRGVNTPSAETLALSTAGTTSTLATKVEKVLQRLQVLERLVDETNAELRQIETLIHSDLLNSE
jgi:DNA-binding SARP family transcriptional activator